MLKYLLLFFCTNVAFGQAVQWETKPVKMLEIPESDLYGGTKSVAGEFPMMCWIGNCTGTVVGPRSIFTASHCATTGKRITCAPRGAGGKSYNLTCTRHPRYNNSTVYNDYALCSINAGEDGFPADLPMASFEFRTPDVGEELLLNGYGAPTVTVHHWGNEKVDRIRSQDIEACGGVYLGGGDSGGSLLAKQDDRSGKSGFKVLGVNSRGGGNCSYFNRVSHEEFQKWAKDYEAEKSVKLCGVSIQCTGSVPPSPSPSPSPVPPKNCWQLYESLGFCVPSKSVPDCLKAYNDFKSCLL